MQDPNKAAVYYIQAPNKAAVYYIEAPNKAAVYYIEAPNKAAVYYIVTKFEKGSETTFLYNKQRGIQLD